MTKLTIPTVIAVLALCVTLTGCMFSAEASNGVPLAPTAAPVTPMPAQPQVIVVQAPAAVHAPAPARDDTAIFVLLAMCGTAVVGALAAMGAFAFGFNRGKSTVTMPYTPPLIVDPRSVGTGRHVVLTESEYAALLADAQRRALEVRR